MNGTPSPDQVLDELLGLLSKKGVELYPAQEEAILELFAGKNVILNTPTGSGKSLVASALHRFALSQGRRSVYTSPIKALVNEKFLALCHELGPEKVGLITGDATVNAEAPVVCCTAEILMTDALRLGAEAPVQDVIMDEFHYYSDRERGVAWQIPLLTLSKTRFLLMSATLGNTLFFEHALTELNGQETVVVRSVQRPVPLHWEWSEISLQDKVIDLTRAGKAPVYLVHFTQAAASEQAQNFLSIDLCSKEEKRALGDALAGYRFSSPFGKQVERLLRHGIGIHHGGLLPKYRLLVEKLAQKGMLKLICGTDTLGVGVNVPIRTVVFTQLCKFDGERTSILSVRDFHQIAGRAGRKGFDREGFVVIQAPEHVIENLKIDAKISADPAKGKKLVKKRPPEKGFVNWTRETFEKLRDGQPEGLTSRFRLTHSLLLQVLARPGGQGHRAMQELIRRCHESPERKKRLRRDAFVLARSLAERGILQLKPLQVHADLQEDFSLHHALSLFLIDALPALPPVLEGDERAAWDHALNVLSLVESILENPEPVLRAQLGRVKRDTISRLKAEGKEYDEITEALEQCEYPKPLRDWTYDTFNAFSRAHPWVGEDNIRPKSVAREMIEGGYSFADYVREYDLERSEGTLLRYLSDTVQVLAQTVPESHRTEALEEVRAYLRTVVEGVDSSLIEEWEKLRDPQFVAHEREREAVESASSRLPSGQNKLPAPGPARPPSGRELERELRSRMFAVIRALARQRWDEVAEWAQGAPKAIELELSLRTYFASHGAIRIDPEARAPHWVRIEPLSPVEKGESRWQVSQGLLDADGATGVEVQLQAVWTPALGLRMDWVGLDGA